MQFMAEFDKGETLFTVTISLEESLRGCVIA